MQRQVTFPHCDGKIIEIYRRPIKRLFEVFEPSDDRCEGRVVCKTYGNDLGSQISDHSQESARDCAIDTSIPTVMQSETLSATSVDIPEIVCRELDILRHEKEVLEAELRLACMKVATMITVSDVLNRNHFRS